jgi:peptidoglycan/LPS O-acetylase OafA/YrhL
MEKYRYELDGLRALAVLVVIINHFDQSLLPSGYLGVDIFFVISGYVITCSLFNRNLDTLISFISQFYVRRIKRLLPTLILISLITGIATVLLVHSPAYSIKTILFSVIGFSNHYLLYKSADYFSPDIKLNTFTHSWSLGVEEQFYLLFPIIFWLTANFQKSHRKYLLYILVFLSILSCYLFIYLNIHNDPSAYLIMPSRFWELGCGSIVFILNAKFGRFIALNKVPSYLLLVLLLACFFIPPKLQLISTISVIILSSLLILLIKSNDITFRLLTQKHIRFIGLISYSLYLWHWPILSLSRWTIGIYWYTVIWQVPLMFLLSILTYKKVENTFRKAQWNSSNRNIIAIGILTSFLTIIILIGVYFYRDKILIKNFPWKNLSLAIEKLDCNLPKYKNPISECLCNETTNKKIIYIIGDSHAGNLVPSIKSAIGDIILVKYLTDRAFINSIFGSNDCGGTICSKNEYQSRLDFFSKQLKKGDVVIFSMARDRIYDGSVNFPGNRKTTIIENNLRLLQIKLRNLGKLIAAKESLFILVDDIPKLCDDYYAQLSRNPMNPCPVGKSISINDRQPLTNIYLSLLNDHVKYIDPHPFLCPDNTCYGIFENKLLYPDASPHFSEYCATILTNYFELKFSEIGLINR